jgi:hypothetical protein
MWPLFGMVIAGAGLLTWSYVGFSIDDPAALAPMIMGVVLCLGGCAVLTQS